MVSDDISVSSYKKEEVDWYWDKLSEGSEKGQCGWINRDRFGVTWQVVPSILGKLMNNRDPVKASRVTQAMINMTKLHIVEIKNAHSGK